MSKNTLIIKNAAKKVNKAVDKGVDNALNKLQKSVPKQIKQRTQLGTGGNFNKDLVGGSKKPISKLSGKYKETRKRYQSNLSSNTGVNTSNLTATGKMLESLEARRISGGRLEVDTDDKTRSDLTGNGKSYSNKKIREFVEVKRPFLGLLDFEVEKARRVVRKEIDKELSKANN